MKGVIAEEAQLRGSADAAFSRLVACLARHEDAKHAGSLALHVPAAKAYFRVHWSPLAAQSISVSWKAEAGGLLPSFDGTVLVRPAEHFDQSVLKLSGEYSGVAGAHGKFLDGTIAADIAKATARQLVTIMTRC
jgi:hypothetical protein